jgi:hypothetical protein
MEIKQWILIYNINNLALFKAEIFNIYKNNTPYFNKDTYILQQPHIFITEILYIAFKRQEFTPFS